MRFRRAESSASAISVTGGKGDSLFYGFILFLILKAISERYRKKRLAQVAPGMAEDERL